MSDNPPARIGTGPGLDAVRRAVARVAPTDATVLILGEIGNGVDRDDAQAAAWYFKAAKLGNADAIGHLQRLGFDPATGTRPVIKVVGP